MALAGLPRHQLELPPPLPGLLGQDLADKATFWFQFLFVTLGLVSLLWNRLATQDAEVRRKIQVVFWGTLVGVVPSLLLAGARRSFGLRTPIWVDALVDVLV